MKIYTEQTYIDIIDNIPVNTDIEYDELISYVQGHLNKYNEYRNDSVLFYHGLRSALLKAGCIEPDYNSIKVNCASNWIFRWIRREWTNAILSEMAIIHDSGNSLEINRYLIRKHLRQNEYSDIGFVKEAYTLCINSLKNCTSIEDKERQKYIDAAKELEKLECVKKISPEELQCIAKEIKLLGTNRVEWIGSAANLRSFLALLWNRKEIKNVSPKKMNDLFNVEGVTGALKSGNCKGAFIITQHDTFFKSLYCILKE